jgi:hypothetical protein
MTEFTLTTLEHYINLGYSHILYYNMEHFAILIPCHSEPETNESSYALTITDEQVHQMACGDDQFSFYVLL